MQILLIQRDMKVNRSVESALQSANFGVDAVTASHLRLPFPEETHYEAILLDVSRLKPHGIALLTDLRRADSMIPLVAFNGCYSPADRVRILEAGADDYLSGPVWTDELVLRTKLLLRRNSMPRLRLRMDGLELNYASRSLIRDNKEISLTPKEFAILELLMRNAGRPVAREKIFDDVWKESAERRPTNVVDVYINFLRKKIDQGFETKLIRTAHRIGYALVNSVPDAA